MAVPLLAYAYGAFSARGSGWLHEVSGNGHPRGMVIRCEDRNDRTRLTGRLAPSPSHLTASATHPKEAKSNSQIPPLKQAIPFDAHESP